MKTAWFAALMVSISLAVAPAISDAKRLGSGKSSGMQRDMPARTAPDAPPAKPATPQQANPAAPATAAAAAGAAAAPKRSWLGPIVGIAAGLGLAALASHLGFGEELASFLLLALLAIVAVVVIRMLMRRFSGQQPQAATAGAGGRSPVQVAWPQQASPQPSAQPMERISAPAGGLGSSAAAPAAVAAAFVPASFDSDGFARIAKTIFVRLQAANDAGDLEDLRRFTTPEMFAELKMDLLERSGTSQSTEVVQVEAQVLDVADDGSQQIVSVRYTGRVREEAGAEPQAFDEVWHLVKPHADEGPAWRIAGIEQMPGSAAH